MSTFFFFNEINVQSFQDSKGSSKGQDIKCLNSHAIGTAQQCWSVGPSIRLSAGCMVHDFGLD